MSRQASQTIAFYNYSAVMATIIILIIFGIMMYFEKDKQENHKINNQ